MSLKRSSNANSLRMQGFTLIEVLVSLFILAVGMLGMTALQNEGLKNNHAAFVDSQAQFLLADMVERIRANPGNNTYVIGYLETPAVITVNCATTSCTSDQMALWDLNRWRAQVENPAYLPDGESQILFNNLTRTFSVSIRYDWSQLGNSEVMNSKRTVTVTTRI